MNKNRRKELSRISSNLNTALGNMEELKDKIENGNLESGHVSKELEYIISDKESEKTDLEIVKDEEEMALDNLPDSLRYSEKGETMEENVSDMESAISDIQDVIDNLEELKDDFDMDGDDLDQNISNLSDIINSIEDIVLK